MAINESLAATSKTDYFYDSRGKMIKSIYHVSDGELFIKEYKYDQFGNILEEIYPDEKGKIQMITKYVYVK